MLIESTSDLISALQEQQLPSGDWVHEASLMNGNALVVAADTLALFRRPGSCSDSLGNGFIRSVAIPAEFHLTPQAGSRACFICEHKAGYVGLTDERVLLITLNDVQLFPSKLSALKNQGEIVRLSLAQG